MPLRINTCGCDCKNESSFDPCGDLLTCGDNCASGAPCAYAAKFMCHYYTDSSVSQPGLRKLLTYPITVLWKECLFDDTEWTARRCKLTISGGACGSLGFENSEGTPSNHINPYEWHQWFPPVWDNGGTPEWDVLEFGCERMHRAAAFNPTDETYYLCGWRDWYGQAYPCAGGPNYWDDFLREQTEIVWKLEVTGAAATMTGYDNGETVIVYECDQFDCLGESNFVVTGDWYTSTFWLPPNVCVVPYSSNWLTPCETKDDACACGDAGWSNLCLDLSGVFCGGIQGSGVLSLARQTDVAQYGIVCYYGSVGGCENLSGCLDLTGIDAPCGIFSTITTTNRCPSSPGASANGMLVFMVWCDGADWNIRITCVEPDGAGGWTCTTICDTTGTVSEICPDGVRFTFDCGTITSDCCQECPPDTVPSDCCDEGLPTTIYATLAVAGCTTDVATLTHSSGNIWTGTGTLGTCGTVDITATVNPGGGCVFEVSIKDGASLCFNSSAGVIPCPFTSIAVTGTWNNPPCSCCTGGGAVTVTLSV